MAMYYLNPSPVRFLGFDNFLRSTSTQSTVKIQNSVKFSEACRVVLIPKREEYAAAGIQLWWSPNEFHKFKKERLAEITQGGSKPCLPKDSDRHENVQCFQVQVRLLIITDEKPMKSRIVKNLSTFLWGLDNKDRQGTMVVVNYVSHDRASEVINERPFFYNIVAVDDGVGKFRDYARLREVSATLVILCLVDNECLMDNDSCSEFSDLVLVHPEVPSVSQWRDIVALLVDRLEAGDFLPSPLIQQYITAL